MLTNRLFLYIIFILYPLFSYSQSKENLLRKIKTIEDANAFIKSNNNIEATLELYDAENFNLHEIRSKFNSVSKIYQTEDKYSKLLEPVKKNGYRVSYIYLDGRVLDTIQIDSLRNVMLTYYKNGTSFSELHKSYNMDSNPNSGDLGWFLEGIMHEDFENAIKMHKVGDLFTLDIPSNKWYYIVFKTYEEKPIDVLPVISIR